MSALGYLMGWALTEARAPLFNFRPFNCRPCMTFWATAGAGLAYALIVSRILARFDIAGDYWVGVYVVTLVGVLLGLINFQYVKSQYKIHD